MGQREDLGGPDLARGPYFAHPWDGRNIILRLRASLLIKVKLAPDRVKVFMFEVHMFEVLVLLFANDALVHAIARSFQQRVGSLLTTANSL